ncbi:MAG: hypothetical protein ACFFA3_14855 [Promethearchaeota archaeon]
MTELRELNTTLSKNNKKIFGGDHWKFSDTIYFKLKGKSVKSDYNPTFPIMVKEIPNLLINKKMFGIFWDTPTFKDTDCTYLFHVHDLSHIDYVISTSSGNTVEAMARAIKTYNEKRNKNVKAILLVPELSAYKVSQSAIENNKYIKYVIMKNYTLDETRDFAKKLFVYLSNSFKVIHADSDMKTAAYTQLGVILKNYNLMNDNVCYVQTVSGGVGSTGLIESAIKYKENPEVLLVQPSNGNSAPIIDALNAHSNGKDPFSIFKDHNYKTPRFEPTLGSTKPIYAIKKFIEWREEEGRIIPVGVLEEKLNFYKNKILNSLIQEDIYPSKYIGLKLFDLEKSGFIAFTGAILASNKIEANNIVVNFTGRYPDPKLIIPKTAKPHFFYKTTENIKDFISKLNLQ